MAVVSQTISPTAIIHLFAGLPRATNNIYPRARVTFDSVVPITLKAAGNTNTVNYNFNLPANYAYRFDQAYVSFNLVTSTEVSQFDDLGVASLSLNAGSGVLLRMLLKSEGLSSVLNTAGGLKTWVLQNPYGEVFQAIDESTVRVTFELFDDHADETVAQDAQVHVSFLQYDVEQFFEVGVNAPQPVNVV